MQDATTIALPDQLADRWSGCGGSSSEGTAAALKCGVQLDLLTGQLRALDLADGRTHDNVLPCATACLPAGTLRLADLGFFDLEQLANLHQAGVYWMSKLRANCVVTAGSGNSQALVRFVEREAAAGWDGWVGIGAKQHLSARLVVVAVSQEVADQRRRRIRKEAGDKGQTPSAAALALQGWTIVITNVCSEMLSVEQALVVMRVRWQIELLFKLWKSHGAVNRWRTSKVERIECEVYGNLLAVVVQHWLLVVSCWYYPDRSLVKASQTIRDFAGEFASTRPQVERLWEALTTVCEVLRRIARINPRRKHPNTYQLLLALSTLAE